MNNQPRPIIEAIIPKSENPEAHLIDTKTGEFPALAYQPEQHQTFEDALHALARLATGASLGVERRLAAPGSIRYQTKPVPSTVEISPAYRWSS